MHERLLETGGIAILPRGAAPKTGADDPVEYYYRPLTSRLYRGRLRLGARLLGATRFGSLLEVGYGSGIFLPELARRTDRLAGLELHSEAARIEELLRRFGVEAELRRGSLFEMPFADGEFDALVCLSVLEHLSDLDAALDELRRVVRPGGVVVLGFPVRNPVTDALFRLAGYDPRVLHPSGHRDILASIGRHPGFRVERRSHLPRVVPLALAAYAGCRCVTR
jgi:SAM-dependent methyltransferase